MDLPEWFGYLAAFEAYTDAVVRGDMVTAEQARKLMSAFAERLAPPGDRKARHRALKGEEGIRTLLEWFDDR